MLQFLKRLFPARDIPTLPSGHRAYVIGDIHGRLDLFDILLGQIATDNLGRPAASVTLILLGDLIDRGPESAGVVKRAMVKPSWADDLVALKGNHEDAMLEALHGNLEMARIWLRVGGQSALESWGVDFDSLEEASIEDVIAAGLRMIPFEQREWLSHMSSFYQLGDYYFVHAGVRPNVPLNKQIHKDLFWIREEFLRSRTHHGSMVVHGHTITEDVEMLGNRIGIDTGAYLSGQLTALGLEGTDRWLLQTKVLGHLPGLGDSDNSNNSSSRR